MCHFYKAQGLFPIKGSSNSSDQQLELTGMLIPEIKKNIYLFQGSLSAEFLLSAFFFFSPQAKLSILYWRLMFGPVYTVPDECMLRVLPVFETMFQEPEFLSDTSLVFDTGYPKVYSVQISIAILNWNLKNLNLNYAGYKAPKDKWDGSVRPRYWQLCYMFVTWCNDYFFLFFFLRDGDLGGTLKAK